MSVKKQEQIQKQRCLCRQKRMMKISCMLCLCLLFVRVPKQPEVAVLDVGQGDGIYIHTSDGLDVFLDGGSMDIPQVGTYRILPFLKAKGVTSIHSWFLSHLDQDHISGFTQLIESGFTVKQVVLAKGVFQDEAYKKFTDRMAKYQIKLLYIQKEDVLQGGHASFTCLGPSLKETADERNARSLVLWYEDRGFRAFFPGDISVKEERELVRDGSLAQVAFYKAAHHGSDDSNAGEILKVLHPWVSAISCAKDNRYGHPGPEAFEAMKENSQAVYQTMESGRIQLRWHKGQVTVQQYCNHTVSPTDSTAFKHG